MTTPTGTEDIQEVTVTATALATFDSLDPATGDVVGTHPIFDAAQVNETVARAREAAQWWAQLSFDERAERLKKWRGVIARRMAQLAELSHAETGKPTGDAQLEIMMMLDHLSWAAGNARKVLGRKSITPSLLAADLGASVEYLPLGVIGVIGPWNFPVFTPMGSIAYALAAGNAVVFKPSEFTPGVGKWLVDAFAQVVPEHPVLQVVTGLGETGAALCRSGVDKVAFTGSTETGKKVMRACADTLTPVLIEAGGKDVLLVDADADLDAAAEAAVWGGLSNAGQACIGTERVYVHEQVYDAFLAKLVALAKPIRAGDDPAAQLGPMTMPSQPGVVARHIADALDKGARAVVGGPDAVGARLVQPTVLVDVPEDSIAMTEETFGPTLAVNKVRDMDEAVERANNSRYGLGSAVFAKRRGVELARRIRSGMTGVNLVYLFAALPELPFGGVGDSGFGRIHGPDGLKEFTYAKSIARRRLPALMALTTFARTPKVDKLLATLTVLRHG
ncbi:aldehyde dehydrogenase family protein [Nocardia goodfellowii]|uniref:Aldehyde dehydrogenase n=1 Tax=Nocardia goodfellowii TaxID=882446 RepID=A0ABS4QNT1_9NOCA|nr:aldehyde dehydrogenase family protein [Nocardia goodfellowii]MBP2193369.1 acyl-CoA reductase-like NAD-dependent aldehyde dehydrogenase [Nocardia goodfellowii]